MSSHLREISEDSVASHDTELSTDALLARTTEEMLVVTEDPPKDEDILLRTLSDNALVVIGRGTCGTIFEIPGTESAYKKISENDLEIWWRENLSRFPDDTQAGYLFQVQRIFPLPKPSREALIGLYFPKEIHLSAYEDPDNKACLIRPYLGQRRGKWEFSSPALSLQNVALYLDQIEELQLEAIQFSKEMAIGLAIVHWKACLDGMDMEFVLGSATTNGELPTVIENFRAVKPFDILAGEFKRLQVHLWMLNFDKANQLNLKKSWKSCCDKMVTAVTANDPYFPNPASTGTLEHKLWDTFERAYLLTASILMLTQKWLPKKSTK
ncbi:hypothetical protein PDIG_03390 [Penicillium digitatum PHI26]|uniref:DUF3669 domain-containing protein n=2 Tax=Penicillium digitatum TaxID=36651 RepID=K9GE28_PEND2|nr:hypothetical protein PDIP_08090 [Penicillium digitatum Pd1]EKV19309.1 hypothetical protein PDIG_03390 [Penicillium digitatum PHI26]EKV21266.1 hypothetical protein PDIP_08090 [Penicillium digitatum Pd1]KAG0154182.1 hypothetical protein PDIDSM_1562 [Penicillium digitatum]